MNQAEVDSTLERLSASKQVAGVLVLQRSSGSIIRATGRLFAAGLDYATTATANDADTSSFAAAAPLTSEATLAERYAESCWRVTETMESELGGLDGNVDATDGAVKFYRVRTRKHELLVTPGKDRYSPLTPNLDILNRSKLYPCSHSRPAEMTRLSASLVNDGSHHARPTAPQEPSIV